MTTTIDTTWTYPPEVDILDLDDSFVVTADIPGADADDIDVSLEEGILTIHAPVANRYPDNPDFITNEFGLGTYHRRFRVGERFDPESIEAQYRDGVLTVTLPKPASMTRRRIQIKTS